MISNATTTADFRSVDIAWLQRHDARRIGAAGRIRWTRNGEETGSICYVVEPTGVRLNYTTRNRWKCGPPEDISELIPVATTNMHLGGVRYWFLCPDCRRRCRILYG